MALWVGEFEDCGGVAGFDDSAVVEDTQWVTARGCRGMKRAV